MASTVSTRKSLPRQRRAGQIDRTNNPFDDDGRNPAGNQHDQLFDTTTSSWRLQF